MLITFSRKFPSYHPRKGEATHFVEKIINQVRPGFDFNNVAYVDELLTLNKHKINTGRAQLSNTLTFEDIESFWISLQPVKETKSHTIRAGHRFKAGNFFSPRVWSGKPYNSPQIQFLPEIEVKKIFGFTLTDSEYFLGNKKLTLPTLQPVACNDGLSSDDFECWFNKPFTGQVICWNKNISY